MAQSDVQYSHPFHTRQGCDSGFFPSAQVQPNIARTRHLPVSTNNPLASVLCLILTPLLPLQIIISN